MARDFYRDFNFTLSAGQIIPVAAWGSYLTILDNNTAFDILVSIDGNAFQPIPAGVSVELPQDQSYAGFLIQNSSAGAMTVHFAISSGKIVDARFKTSATLNTSDANLLAELQGITTPGTFAADATVGVAAVSALASNAARKACLIQADATNTGKIFLGFDNTVTTVKKIITLSPGASFVVDDYRGDIYAISDTAAQKISASWW